MEDGCRLRLPSGARARAASARRPQRAQIVWPLQPARACRWQSSPPPRARLAWRRAAFDAGEDQASATPNPPQRALRPLEWVDRAEVLVVCGPSGPGTSHFIEALGHLVIDHGRTVAWHTLETL